jgi:hypothetical protein
MSKNQVVIVSNKYDNHADDLSLKLCEMGHVPIRLNTDEIPLSTTMSFHSPNGSTRWRGSIALHANGARIDLDAIRSIWWRRPTLYFGLPAELGEQEREFAREEIDAILHGAWSTVDCYWISNPDNIHRAGRKMEQLQRAARFGFEIPRTLITSDPEEVRSFYDVCNGQMVFKVMTDPLLGAPTMAEKHPDQPSPSEQWETKTTMITGAELEHLESVRLVPCLFQEYIPKRLEYRITIIGDDIFAAEIDSQSRDSTTVDWRNWNEGGFDIPYRKADLPVEIAERCLALVRSYDLNFSALDLILTPDDRYVFIENNPNGQFIWVEMLVPELEMTAALAACLIRGANS